MELRKKTVPLVYALGIVVLIYGSLRGYGGDLGSLRELVLI